MGVACKWTLMITIILFVYFQSSLLALTLFTTPVVKFLDRYWHDCSTAGHIQAILLLALR